MIEALKAKNISVNQSKVLIMGICFKENCSDIRNSKVVDVIEELKTNNVTVEVQILGLTGQKSQKNMVMSW